MSLINRSAPFLFIGTHVVTAILLITVKLTVMFSLEQMGVFNLTGKWLKIMKDSAVSDDLLQCICTIDFDHFDILATDVCNFNLLVKESLLNKRDNPALNRAAKSFSLELFD